MRTNTYIGIAVTRIPIPKPAMNLATKNIDIATEPEHSAAPITMMKAPSWMDRFLPNLSADQAVNQQPQAEPAEFKPFMAPIRFDV